ncbi:uncharacterized protein LOC106958426 [Poecilia latipinna]|uniref:uncharacterized protein LOC106958426 n=1 Tax=Poecilia latipinna TaxID=48699 RepID=UPI00072E1010|nr:PREDICTED: uncharacterized protein LOC106958426 [Poecilia latipinna]XP_014905803.1 PREDICTED: uncharacterized protein LOC106958426 [Poecilia latipinna]
MAVLLRKVRRTNAAAASVLEQADFRTDSEIRSLTRADLHELFPGPEKLKLRRIIFRIIKKHKPINVLLKELEGFVLPYSLRDSLSCSGVLVDYLHTLKGMKDQLNNVQSVIEAHIHLLEDISKAQPHQEQDSDVLSSPGTKAPSLSPAPYITPENGHSYAAQVMYQMVVGGKTFDAHLQLMAEVQAQVRGRVQLLSCSKDGQVFLVFCPVTSRTGADVDGAMRNVTGGEPVILVLMHHTLSIRPTATRRMWSDYSNIVLHVNIFYHKKARGLLKCQENNAAVIQIQNKLLEYCTPRSKWAVTGGYNSPDIDSCSHLDGEGSEFGFRLFDSDSSSSSTSSSNSDAKSIWGPVE